MPAIFCGNGDTLPAGYGTFGTRYECLRKGFGAGLSARSTLVPLLVFVLVCLVVVCVLALVIKYKDEDAEYNPEHGPDTQRRI